jgi:hypothetical protein
MVWENQVVKIVVHTIQPKEYGTLHAPKKVETNFHNDWTVNITRDLLVNFFYSLTYLLGLLGG